MIPDRPRAGSDRRGARLRGAAALAALAVVAQGEPPAEAGIRFVETGAARGIGPYTPAIGPVSGVAAADYDGDGDVDLFVPQGAGFPDLLYRNQGDGSFEEMAASAGLASLANNRAALWLDYDGDHDLDLAVGSDCRFDDAPVFTFPLPRDPCPDPATHRLYRQESGGRFTDVTAQAGLEVTWGGARHQHRSGMAAGDFDGDGWVDLFTSTWNGRSWLLRNRGDGTFSDVTTSAGIGTGSFHHQTPIMADMNADGWPDIYSAVDIFRGNFLWLNRGDGTFINVAVSAGVDSSWTDMGVDLGDYDNDGDMDLYVTNITEVTSRGEYRHNVFYRNDGADGRLLFKEISTELGVDGGWWGWGTVFLDADNDGWLDLAATNGRDWRAYATDPSRFWLNTGGRSPGYVDAGHAAGFDDTCIASALIAVDLEGDGDTDLVQATLDCGLRLMENRPGPDARRNRHLAIRPRMSGANRFALGAVVRVEAGGLAMTRHIKAGVSTLGQEPYEARFGTGRHAVAASVRVEWPAGGVLELARVPTGRTLTLSDSCDNPVTGIHPPPATREGGREAAGARWRGHVVRCDPAGRAAP